MTLTITDAEAKELMSIGNQVGFRNTEVVDGKLLVNGQAILIKGVNQTMSMMNLKDMLSVKNL